MYNTELIDQAIAAVAFCAVVGVVVSATTRKRTVGDVSSQISDLRSAIAEMDARYEDLLIRANNRDDELSEKIKRISSDNDELHEAMSTLSKELIKHRGDVEKLSKKLRKLRDRVGYPGEAGPGGGCGGDHSGMGPMEHPPVNDGHHAGPRTNYYDNPHGDTVKDPVSVDGRWQQCKGWRS